MTTTRFLQRILLASAALAALAPAARAGIAVSPLKQEISLRPGEYGKLTVTLSDVARDDQAPPQSLHIEVTDVQVSEDGSLGLPGPASQPNSASKWITLSDTDVTLAPGKVHVLDVTITPPVTAPPGEYYSSVLVTLGTKKNQNKGLIVQYRVASGIFLTVQGTTLSKQAKIKSTQFIWPTEVAASPVAPADAPPPATKPTLAVVLQNTGKARFDGSGKLRIFDKDSHLLYRTALTSARPCIFAGDSRLFEAVLSKPLAPGNYTARIEMDYQSSWSSARLEMPLNVTPEQSLAWTRASSHTLDEAALIEAGPEKITTTAFPGSSRSLAVNLRNISDTPLHATTSLDTDHPTLPDSWLSFPSDELTLGKAGRRNIPLRLQIPTDAKPGNYSTTLIVHAGPQGLATDQTLTIPIDLEVKPEKP